MSRHVVAIAVIFLCSSLAWFILGANVESRTSDAGNSLGPRVGSSWGLPQTQGPPVAYSSSDVSPVTTSLTLERSRVRADLDLEQRQKGLLWFATYRVAFAGDYLFRNDTPSETVMLRLKFPEPEAIYDDVVFRVNGQAVQPAAVDGAMQALVTVPHGSTVRFETGYRSQGMTTWCYSLGSGVSQIRDFQLDLTTDFMGIDFPANTLSPTTKALKGNGWHVTWKYNNLVTGYAIGMILPQKLQPGPLVGRISFFAPVSLLFFFFLTFIITKMRGIDLHPMHYFFLAASFFAFHLLLAYLADHVSIHLAFAIASAVSIFLVVSYLRIVAGPRFAMVDAALTQLVYLVGFSYAFFFEGFTGLAITIGAIVTLFVVMQMTARVDWRAGEEAPAPGRDHGWSTP